MVLHGTTWYCMVLHGIACYCMLLHGVALSCTTWPPDHLTTWSPDHLTTWPHDRMTTGKEYLETNICGHQYAACEGYYRQIWRWPMDFPCFTIIRSEEVCRKRNWFENSARMAKIFLKRINQKTRKCITFLQILHSENMNNGQLRWKTEEAYQTNLLIAGGNW